MRSKMVRKLVYKPEVLDNVGLSYPTIWSMMRQDLFPRSVRVGGRVAWYEDEVAAWIESRERQTLKGDSVTSAAGLE